MNFKTDVCPIKDILPKELVMHITDMAFHRFTVFTRSVCSSTYFECTVFEQRRVKYVLSDIRIIWNDRVVFG